MSHLQNVAGVSNSAAAQPNPNPNPAFHNELNGLLNRVRPQEPVTIEDNDGGSAPPALMQKEAGVATLAEKINQLQLMIEQFEKKNQESAQLNALRDRLTDLREVQFQNNRKEIFKTARQKAAHELNEIRRLQEAGQEIVHEETLDELYQKLEDASSSLYMNQQRLSELSIVDAEFRESHREYYQLAIEKARAERDLYQAKYDAKLASAPARRYARR